MSNNDDTCWMCNLPEDECICPRGVYCCGMQYEDGEDFCVSCGEFL